MSQPLLIPDGRPPADLDEGSVFFVGTATVILRYGGFTILTDPNFLHRGEQVHLGFALTSERLTEPALPVDRLPPIDFVLLSHLHEDHFDRLVERELDRTLPILTTPRAAEALRSRGFAEARGLGTWEALVVRRGDVEVRVTAMPAQHGPGPVDLLLPDLMGAMLEFGRLCAAARLRVYVSGDTVVHGQLREIPRRYPSIDLALLHLGGTRVLGVLVTMDAAQAVAAVRLVGPHVAVPIHYDDYDVFRSPLEEFAAAARREGLAGHVRCLRRGEAYVFRPSELRTMASPSQEAAVGERG